MLTRKSLFVSLDSRLSSLIHSSTFSLLLKSHILPQRLAEKIRAFFETSITVSSSFPSNNQPTSCCGPFLDESSFPSHGTFTLPYPSSNVSELSQIQKETKVKGSWILPYAHKSDMSIKLNADILEVCKQLEKNGQTPIAGFTVHPSDGKELVIRTTAEALLNGAKVSKLHCSVGNYSVLDENLQGYFELAEKVGFPLVTHLGTSITGHTSTPEVSNLEKLLMKYPKMKLVLAHSASPAVLDAIALAKKYPNLYLDTTPTVTRTVPYPTPSSASTESYRDLMNLAKQGRVLFGSDLPNVSVTIQETIRQTIITFGNDQDRETLSKVKEGDLDWLRESQEYIRRGEGDPVYEVLFGAQKRLVDGVKIDSLLKEKDRSGKL